MGNTRQIGNGFEICEMFLLCERTVRRGLQDSHLQCSHASSY